MKNAPAVIKKAEVPDLASVANSLMCINARSRETYGYYMKSYKHYCEKNNLPQDFTSITQWLDSIDNSNSKTVALAAVKAVLKQLYKSDPRFLQLRQDLADIKLIKKHRAVTGSMYLTKPMIDELIKKSPKNISLMIEAFFWTALRCSELLSIELKNCTLAGKVYEIRVVGKGSKENVVYLEKKFFEKCKSFFGSKKYLFEHKGKQFSREHVSREIAKAGLLIGKDISAHKLRHSAACYMRDVRKLPLDKISKALNHSSIATTAGFYLHGAPDAKERGII